MTAGRESPRERAERLERAASARRERLMRSLDALDVRRHRAARRGRRVEHLLLPAGGVAVGIAVLAVVGEAIYARRVRRRRSALRRFLVRQAERLELRPRQPPFLLQAGRSVLLSVLTFVLSSLAKRALRPALVPAEQRGAVHGLVE